MMIYHIILCDIHLPCYVMLYHTGLKPPLARGGAADPEAEGGNIILIVMLTIIM